MIHEKKSFYLSITIKVFTQSDTKINSKTIVKD